METGEDSFVLRWDPPSLGSSRDPSYFLGTITGMFLLDTQGQPLHQRGTTFLSVSLGCHGHPLGAMTGRG